MNLLHESISDTLNLFQRLSSSFTPVAELLISICESGEGVSSKVFDTFEILGYDVEQDFCGEDNSILTYTIDMILRGIGLSPDDRNSIQLILFVPSLKGASENRLIKVCPTCWEDLLYFLCQAQAQAQAQILPLI